MLQSERITIAVNEALNKYLMNVNVVYILQVNKKNYRILVLYVDDHDQSTIVEITRLSGVITGNKINKKYIKLLNCNYNNKYKIIRQLSEALFSEAGWLKCGHYSDPLLYSAHRQSKMLSR